MRCSRRLSANCRSRLAGIDGVSDFHLVRCGDEMLVLVILADNAQALDRLRDEVGNDGMRPKVIPHAAGPPERMAGEVVLSYQRA